jgi:hypothetical protein
LIIRRILYYDGTTLKIGNDPSSSLTPTFLISGSADNNTFAIRSFSDAYYTLLTNSATGNGDYYIDNKGNSTANQGITFRFNGTDKYKFKGDGSIYLYTAPSTYSSGGYDAIVWNQTSNRLEKTTISGGSVVTLASYYTDATNSGSSTTDLYSYTLAANKLVNNGDRIDFKYSGELNSPTSAVIKFWFAGGPFTPTGISATGKWVMEGSVYRVDTTHVRVDVKLSTDTGVQFVQSTGDQIVSDLTSNTSIVKITGQDSSGSTITARNGSITYCPAP